MFLNLKHKELEVYKTVSELIKEVYKLTLLLPAEEKFNMVPQIRRAAISVKLNVAEGSSRKSEAERKRFFEISRGSLVEIDAAFETAIDLKYLSYNQMETAGVLLNKGFAMLSKMIK